MKFTKKELPLVFHGVTIVALFCLLLASIVIFMNRSVAWFASNEEVTADGASVTLKEMGVEAKYYAKYNDQDYQEITSWAHVFENLVPGDKVTIKAEYSSNGNADSATTKLQASFKALEEVPLTKAVSENETRYYYLGSQLKVTQKTINGGTPTPLTDQFLVTPSDNQIYHAAQGTPNEITLTSDDGLQVPAEGSCTLEFTVEFVNLSIDQNDYQGFGKGNEKCLWQLVTVVAS